MRGLFKTHHRNKAAFFQSKPCITISPTKIVSFVTENKFCSSSPSPTSSPSSTLTFFIHKHILTLHCVRARLITCISSPTPSKTSLENHIEEIKWHQQLVHSLDFQF